LRVTELGGLGTEKRAPALADLDQRPTVEIVRAVVRGHHDVLAAVEAAEPAIAALADATVERLDAGGRVIYVGAGSGGRLALVDASEWGPTFSVPDGTIVALVAGIEHPPGSPEEAAAEDDVDAGAAAVAALTPRAQDVVIAVSASGRTPYAVGALAAAKGAMPAATGADAGGARTGAVPSATGADATGAFTAAVVCTPGSDLAALADLAIEVPVGPEAIAGSTRLKAGTAQKLVLNAFSTAVMVRRGRTLGDLMTSMRVANEKLRDRATRVCMAAAGCDEARARQALASAEDDVALAVVMLVRHVDATTARRLLDASGGALRAALGGAATPQRATAGRRPTTG
jgi:N-acetylmuramic acid 6-phosphate etherase